MTKTVFPELTVIRQSPEIVRASVEVHLQKSYSAIDDPVAWRKKLYEDARAVSSD